MDVSITYRSTMRYPIEHHIAEIQLTAEECMYCQANTEELPSGERSFTHFMLNQTFPGDEYPRYFLLIVCYLCLEADLGWLRAAKLKISLEKSTDIDDLKPLLNGWMRSINSAC